MKVVRIFPYIGAMLLLLAGLGFQAAEQEEEIQLPPITMETLGNGLKVIVIERPRLPIVHITVSLPAGSIFDPREKSALAEFTANMLTEGTESRTADEIAEEIDFVGGSLFATAGVDTASVTTRVLTKDLDVGLDLLADVLLHPTFPEDEMEIVRNRMVGGVKLTRDDPGSLARVHLRHVLFGPDHPFGYVESEETVNAMTRADLVNFYQRFYRPGGSTLVVAGDVEREDIIARIGQRLGPWPRAETIAPDLLPLEPLRGHGVRFVNKPGQTQVQIQLGHRGLEETHPDLHRVEVANYVLGSGGFTSRLFKVIRTEESKTYSISSSFPSYSFPGYFRVGTFTRNEQLRPTLELAMAELEKFRDEGLTPDELELAQDHIAGSYVLRLVTLGGLAGTILDAELLGRGLNWVRNYKRTVRSYELDEVNAIVRKHYRPENLQIVLLGDLAVLEGLPQGELLPQLDVAGVEVVDWLDPVDQPGTGYEELAAAQAEEGTLEVAWNAQMDASARALLEGAVAAQGGLEGLRSLKNHYIKAKVVIHQFGQTLDAEAEQWVVPPNRLSQTVNISFQGITIPIVQVWDGTQGWIKQGPQTQDMPAELLQQSRDNVELDPLVMLLFIGHKDFVYNHGGTAEFGGVEAQVLKVTNAGGRTATFYFDPETFYPLGITVQTGGQLQESFWSDHRTVDGYVYPFSQRTLVDGEPAEEVEVQEIRFNQTPGGKVFQKP